MNKKAKQQCWYEILGLPQYANEEAIKKAFRQMSLKHHPDKGGDGMYSICFSSIYDLLDGKLTCSCTI